MSLRTIRNILGHWLQGTEVKIDEELNFVSTANPEIDSSGGSLIQTIKDADANSFTLKDSGGVDVWKVDTVAKTVTILSPYVLGGISPETLAATLAAGNTTGGTNIVMTAGDKLQSASGQAQLDLWYDFDDNNILLSSDGEIEDETYLKLLSAAYGKVAQLVSRGNGILSITDTQIIFQNSRSTSFTEYLKFTRKAVELGDTALNPLTAGSSILVQVTTNGDITSRDYGSEGIFLNTGDNGFLSTFKQSTVRSVILGGRGITAKTSNAAYANTLILQPETNLFDGALTPPTLTADRTWTFPDASGTVALIPVSGTPNTISMFTAANAIGDSPLALGGLGNDTLTFTNVGAKFSVTDGSKIMSLIGTVLQYDTGTYSGQLNIDGGVSLTGNRSWDMPDASGTIALADDITSLNVAETVNLNFTLPIATNPIPTGWVTGGFYLFAGTGTKTITKIEIGAQAAPPAGPNAITDYDIRVIDITNGGAVIATITALAATGADVIYDLGTISNLPATGAIFEIQTQVNAGGTAGVVNLRTIKFTF